jgi:hypothetical protein
VSEEPWEEDVEEGGESMLFAALSSAQAIWPEKDQTAMDAKRSPVFRNLDAILAVMLIYLFM